MTKAKRQNHVEPMHRICKSTARDEDAIAFSMEGKTSMQPFSYQSAGHTCWIACMINGIRHVSKKERIQTKVYRLLHCLLRDEGVYYYTKQQLINFHNVIEEVAWLTKLDIRRVCGSRVARAVEELRFDGKAVVCDVGNGEHSILLTCRKGDWLEAFDPYWYEERIDNANITIVDDNPIINTRIQLNHLINDGVSAHINAYRRGEAYPMGQKIEKRFLTVIEMPR